MDKNIDLDEFVKYIEDKYDPCDPCDDYDPCDPCDKMPLKGTIIVKSVLGDCEDGEPLECVEIELYVIDNCTAPGFKLIDCKCTDEDGKVTFRCLELNKCYAIRQVVPDNCLTPKYYKNFKAHLTEENRVVRITVLNLPPRHHHGCHC